MRDRNTYFDGKFIRQTERAICFEVDGEKIWFPKSLIEDISAEYGEIIDNEEVQFCVPTWWAKQEGLE